MRLIDVDELGVVRCSKDVLPAAYCAGWNGLIGLIEKAPTIDAVPVVRCKDCKFGTHFGDMEDEWIRCMNLHGNPLMPFDGFCSYGERKEGAE